MAKESEIRTVEPDESCFDDEGKIPFLVRSAPASPELVALVLNASEDSDDGRSEWRWFRLPNGDLILGVYPQGDTYCETEGESCF